MDANLAADAAGRVIARRPIADATHPRIVTLGLWRSSDRALTDFLGSAGYVVGAAAEHARRGHEGDLAVVDLTALGPDGTGAEPLKQLVGARALIVIADPGQGAAGLRALELGADDVLLRPVNPRELLARVRSVWRGVCDHPKGCGGYAFAGFRLNPRRYSLEQAGGDSVPLHKNAFRLLLTLLEHANEVVSREALQAALGEDHQTAGDRSIDIQVLRLRQKLGDSDRRLVRTVRGRGYQLAGQVRRC